MCDSVSLGGPGQAEHNGDTDRGTRQGPCTRHQGEISDAGTRDGREGESPAAGLGVQQGTQGRSSDPTKQCPEGGHGRTGDSSQTLGERVGLTRCMREIRGSNGKREE